MPLNSVGASLAAVMPVPLSSVQKKESSSEASLDFNSFDLESGGNSPAPTGDASGAPSSASLSTPPSSNNAAATVLPSQAPDPDSLTGVTVYNSLGKLQSLSPNAGLALNLSA